MITALVCSFRNARRALAVFALGMSGCVLTQPAVANPFLYNIRPTEMFLLAKSADDPVLRGRIAGLSPSVNPDEAQRVVECAYNTGRQLAREWNVVSLPGVQNYLVNTGARKGGLCFQYAGELLIRLVALKLQTLDLHWAESYPGTGAEHNVIVVTAKGQAFRKGVILDNWRYQGHLVYCWVPMDPQYKWVENPGELARRLEAIAASKRPALEANPAGTPHSVSSRTATSQKSSPMPANSPTKPSASSSRRSGSSSEVTR